MTPDLGIDRGPLWWKASALTTGCTIVDSFLIIAMIKRTKFVRQQDFVTTTTSREILFLHHFGRGRTYFELTDSTIKLARTRMF